MEFSFQLPTRAVQDWPAWSGEHQLADLAIGAEQAGFDYVTTTDHPFPPEDWLAQGGHHAFDPFVALAFMAAATTRVKLLTFVLVAGYRNPYIVAKAAASLDLLSRGRLVLGMAAGYNQAEFAVLDAPFATRGKRFDDALDAMRTAWSGSAAAEVNPTFPAMGHVMLPRPAQPLGPPVWIGGNSTAAMRRAAQRGDGWMPFGQDERSAAVTGSPALSTIDHLADKIGELLQMRADSSRAVDAEGRGVAVCFTPRRIRGASAQADQIASDLSAYRAAGVTCLAVESQARDFAECQQELEMYRQVLLD